MPGRARRDGPAGSSAQGGERQGGSAGRDRQGGGRDRQQDRTATLERVVAINRVAKVVKGGRRFSFTALVVVGDGDGMVGVGYGKAKEVPAAIAKGVEEAKKNFFRVPRVGGTITHPVQGEEAAGVVLLRPASPGTGVIAGGPVRAVLECAGIADILSKSLGSQNAINIVHATVAALKGLQVPEAVAARRGLPLEDVAPARMLRARSGQGCDVADLKVTQIKSQIGGKRNQRETLRTLGLRRIGATVVRPDDAQNRGLIATVRHLVTVEEVK